MARKKIYFLGEIEEFDFSIDPDKIDFKNKEQVDAYEKQTRRNQIIILKKDLLAQYKAGVIDKDGNSLVFRRSL
jgi:hypothetical protein